MGKTKNNAKKENTVTIKVSDRQLGQIRKCCDVMEISQSDFIRQAIEKEIYRSYKIGATMELAETLQNVSDELKKNVFDVDCKKKLEEIQEITKSITAYDFLVLGVNN